ncbi:MAG TPA: hypothetical protein VGV59_17070 [Pyrinomonadaceae bacterium]|nr:hypothetical protein [Pyrinomonadaceae bacterium]
MAYDAQARPGVEAESGVAFVRQVSESKSAVRHARRQYRLDVGDIYGRQGGKALDLAVAVHPLDVCG